MVTKRTREEINKYEHIEDINTKRVILVDISGNPYTAGSSESFKTYNLEEVGTITYIGKASILNWEIQKIVDSSGNLTITYADIDNNSGVETYSNAWTNRTTLVYGGA